MTSLPRLPYFNLTLLTEFSKWDSTFFKNWILSNGGIGFACRLFVQELLSIDVAHGLIVQQLAMLSRRRWCTIQVVVSSMFAETIIMSRIFTVTFIRFVDSVTLAGSTVCLDAVRRLRRAILLRHMKFKLQWNEIETDNDQSSRIFVSNIAFKQGTIKFMYSMCFKWNSILLEIYVSKSKDRQSMFWNACMKSIHSC